jgi:hypothetical protein
MQKKKTPSPDKIRPIAQKRFKLLEEDVRKTVETVNVLEQQIINYDNIISSKTIIIPATKKDEQPTTIPLTAAQVRGYRLERRNAKLKLRKARKEKKDAGNEFSKACTHNGEFIQQQSKNFSAKLQKESKARVEKDERKKKIVDIVSNLLKENDNRMLSLTEAVTDGRSFRKEMDKLLSNVDPETFATISGLSEVKTEIYSEVRNLLKEDDQESISENKSEINP